MVPYIVALRSLWFRHDGVFSPFPHPLTASSKSRDIFGGITLNTTAECDQSSFLLADSNIVILLSTVFHQFLRRK